jgi:Mg2+-importing ATPase
VSFLAKWRGAHPGSRLTPAAGAACDLTHYWGLRAEDVADALGSSRQGLSTVEAEDRLRTHGPNRLRSHEVASFLQTLVNQIKSPLLLLLVFAAGASIASRELIDATIVLTIVAATIAIGFYRESSAQTAIAALRSKVHTRSDVTRDGRVMSIAAEDIVPGDVVHLSAGDLVPADGLLIDASDLFVNQAVMTGESFPVVKKPGAGFVGHAWRDRTSSGWGRTSEAEPPGISWCTQGWPRSMARSRNDSR